MWLLDSKKSIAISCLPKCATHSLREAFDWQSTVNNMEVTNINKRIAFIREPFERLISNYSFFYNAKGSFSGWDYERFIDFVLDEHSKNFHWCSQVQSLTLHGKFMPTICFKFDDISEVIYKQFKKSLNLLNKSEHKEISDYRIKDLIKYFSEDINLYGKL
jgi:hypothetical protein